jgi:ABC-type multidrug transport system permease subunit
LRHTWILSLNRIRLALRSRVFIFFSLVMPLGFLFLYAAVFARGDRHAMAYLLGAVLGLTVMGSFWGLSMQLVMFREAGILRRFRLAPIGAGAMLGSSIISNYFLTLPTILIEFVIARWLFKMDTWGNVWGILLLVTVGSATFAALGLIVASVTNTMQETQVINNVIWIAFLFFSGATIPLFSLPGWLQHASLFLPATYLVSGLEGAMLNTASAGELVGDFIVLAIGLGVAFEISRQLFRWEPEAKVSGRAKIWVVVAMIPFLLLGVWENVYGNRLNQIRTDLQSMMQRSVPDQQK